MDVFYGKRFRPWDVGARDRGPGPRGYDGVDVRGRNRELEKGESFPCVRLSNEDFKKID